MAANYNHLVGKEGSATVFVTGAHTAATMGSGTVAVFATPALIALMEQAAVNALNGHIEAENCSVGTSVAVQHLQATPIGLTVNATATVTAVEGRKVKFNVTASDDKEVVGKGEHERFILNTDKFLAKANSKAPAK